MTRIRNVCVIVGLAATMAARADWVPGDPYKMHFPQLPDPTGWDVDFTFPQIMADDWLCIETGPVSAIHFWFSFEHDIQVPLRAIHLSVHADIPAGPTNPFSRPGEPLWERDFSVTDPHVRIRPYGHGEQGWYDPKNNFWQRPDHFDFFQANITDIPQPFFQRANTIYWLDISVLTEPGGRAGWKTSLNHFNDDAVWAHWIPGVPPDWHELRDPLTGQSLDMAFVIVPTPASAVLMGMGVLAAYRRRRP